MPQSITVAECFSYCDGMRWHSPEFKQDLLDLVQDMDDAFVAHHAKKREEAARVKKPGSDVVG